MAQIVGVDINAPDLPGEHWRKDHGKEVITNETMH